MNPTIALINKRSLKKSIPDIATGDVVRVSQKIKEGAKTRAQVFEGMVIARDGGNGVTASITVRKIASGVGVEKKFLLNSPNVEGVKVLRSSKVRRKKIYFLRGLTGKAAKIKEKQRKMMEEIGLKEDEIVENAETTEELAQPAEEENNESGITNNEEGSKQESDTEKPVDAIAEEKVEESPVETNGGSSEEKVEEPAVDEKVEAPGEQEKSENEEEK